MPNIYKEPITVPAPPTPAPPKLPKDFGPAYDVKNAIYLNDYRNRLPFKVEEDDADYEWAYGSTMDLVFTISDEDKPVDSYNYKYVVDVRNLGKSIVDEATKVAHLTVSDMAYQSKDNYITTKVVGDMLVTALNLVDKAEHLLVEAGKKYDRVATRLKEANAWPLKK